MSKKFCMVLFSVELFALLSGCCITGVASSSGSSNVGSKLYSNAQECLYSNGNRSLVVYYPDGFPRVCSVYSDKSSVGKHLIYDFDGNILSRLGCALCELWHGDNFYEGIIADGKHEPQLLVIKAGVDAASLKIDAYYYIDDDLKLVIGLWVKDVKSGMLSKLVTRGGVVRSGKNAEYSGVEQELTGAGIRYVSSASEDGLLHLRFEWQRSSGKVIPIETSLELAK